MMDEPLIHMAKSERDSSVAWSLKSVCGEQDEGDLLALDESSVDCVKCHEIMEEER